MAIEVERIEILGANVPDVDKARELFADLFDVEFLSFTAAPEPGEGIDAVVEPVEVTSGTPEEQELQMGDKGSDPETVHNRVTRAAIDKTGYFELIETDDPAGHGMRNIHLKVADIDAAMAEMQGKGISVLANIKMGGMREVVFNPDDLYGIRLCFVAYDGPSLIESMLSS